MHISYMNPVQKLELTTQHLEKGHDTTKKNKYCSKNTLKSHHMILITIIHKEKNFNNLKIYESPHIKTNPMPSI